MAQRTPKPVVYTEGEMALADGLGMDTAQLRVIKQCPDCDGHIIVCDNAVWLDAKTAAEDEPIVMGMMTFGGLLLAASPADGEGGSRHTLHEHQPDPEDDES